MYIYIDETFNLEKGTKNQFLAVAGFSTPNTIEAAKWYQKVKKKALPKKYNGKEMKSTDRLINKYILPKLFSSNIELPNIKISAVIQYKNNLPQSYYYKNELNYDLLYLEVVKKLLRKSWSYKDKEIIIVTLDTFKTKTLRKAIIANKITTILESKYPHNHFEIIFGTSEERNLQLADQICGIINRYVKGDKKYYQKIRKTFGIKIIKNPL